MKVPLALIADYANVTAEGKLNIMGIFDTIFVPGGFPTVHPQMRLIVRFQVAPAEQGSTKLIEIKLLDADGNLLLAMASTIQLPQDLPLNAEFPQIVELNGLTFSKAGDYAFSVLVGGEEKANVPFHVVPLTATPLAPPAQQGS